MTKSSQEWRGVGAMGAPRSEDWVVEGTFLSAFLLSVSYFLLAISYLKPTSKLLLSRFILEVDLNTSS